MTRRSFALLAFAAVWPAACLDAGPLARACDPEADDCAVPLVCVPHDEGGVCLPDPRAPVCNRVEIVERDVVIEDAEDLESFLPASFAGCVELRGSLTVSATPLVDLDPLRALVSIDGDLTIVENESLEDLSGLDELRVVIGAIQVLENPAVRVPGLRSLESTDSLAWTGPAAGALALDVLTAVGRELALSNLVDVESVSLPSLQRAGTLRVTFNPELRALDAPALTQLSDAIIHDNPRLSACLVDDLVAAAGPSSVEEHDNGPCE